MDITPKITKNYAVLADLQPGNTFIYNDQHFIKTDNDSYNAVSLIHGNLVCIAEKYIIRHTRITAEWKDVIK